MPDTSIQLSSKCANSNIYGMVSITDASYAAEPGRFVEEVDLGVSFNSQPVIQLTQKEIHDDGGNVYDSGEHEFSYRWIDAVHFSKFEIILQSSRLNYPPSISYLVSGNIGIFQRLLYCIFH